MTVLKFPKMKTLEYQKEIPMRETVEQWAKTNGYKPYDVNIEDLIISLEPMIEREIEKEVEDLQEEILTAEEQLAEWKKDYKFLEERFLTQQAQLKELFTQA